MDTVPTAKTAVATAVVMASVGAVRNAASTASGIAGAVLSSLSLVFVAASYGELLFVYPAIVQPL